MEKRIRVTPLEKGYLELADLDSSSEGEFSINKKGEIDMSEWIDPIVPIPLEECNLLFNLHVVGNIGLKIVLLKLPFVFAGYGLLLDMASMALGKPGLEKMVLILLIAIQKLQLSSTSKN